MVKYLHAALPFILISISCAKVPSVTIFSKKPTQAEADGEGTGKSQVSLFTIYCNGPAGFEKGYTLEQLRLSLGAANCQELNVRLSGSTSLKLSNKSIRDIEFLRYFPQLTALDLRANKIIDVSPLKDLKQLSTLDLSNNEIKDLSPIRDLAGLKELGITNNLFSDLTAIIKLKNLTSLKASDNQVTDISPLKGLTNLEILSIHSNPFNDASALTSLVKLKNLDLSALNTNITNPAVLSQLIKVESLKWSSVTEIDLNLFTNLRSLKELSIIAPSFKGLDILGRLPQLKSLRIINLNRETALDHNYLRSLPYLEHFAVLDQAFDLSTLNNSTNLLILSINGTPPIDLSTLTRFPLLKEVYLSSAACPNPAPINLTQLESMRIGDSTCPDHGIINAPLLKKLEIFFNPSLVAANVQSLSIFREIEELSLRSSKLNDLSFVKSMPNLRKLKLDGTRISDIGPLSGLGKLQDLGLQFNEDIAIDLSLIKDLPKLDTLQIGPSMAAPLLDLNLLNPRLRKLDLRESSISNCLPLGKLVNLEILNLNSNADLGDISCLSNLTKIRALGLEGATKISSITSIQKLTSLRYIFLNLTQVQDIEPLAKLPMLEGVDLSQTPVPSVEPLAKLERLEHISFDVRAEQDSAVCSLEPKSSGIEGYCDNRSRPVPLASVLYSLPLSELLSLEQPP